MMGAPVRRSVAAKRRDRRPTDLGKGDRRSGDPIGRTARNCSQAQALRSSQSVPSHHEVRERTPFHGLLLVDGSAPLELHLRPMRLPPQVHPPRRYRPKTAGPWSCRQQHQRARCGCDRGTKNRRPMPRGGRTAQPERSRSIESSDAPSDAMPSTLACPRTLPNQGAPCGTMRAEPLPGPLVRQNGESV